jgi:hypothetical protein
LRPPEAPSIENVLPLPDWPNAKRHPFKVLVNMASKSGTAHVEKIECWVAPGPKTASKQVAVVAADANKPLMSSAPGETFEERLGRMRTATCSRNSFSIFIVNDKRIKFISCLPHLLLLKRTATQARQLGALGDGGAG